MFYHNKREFFTFCNLRDTFQYPLHVHQFFEYVYVKRGCIEMQIGEKKYMVRAGELALIFPNIVHDYHTISAKGETELHFFTCYPDVTPLHKTVLLNMFPKHSVLRKKEIHPDVLYAENRLFELDRRNLDRTLVGSLVSLILSRILPCLDLSDYSELPPQEIYCKIISYISQHYCEDISLDSVAKHFGIGRTSLSRIFSNVLKISFTQYLNSLRIYHAEYLLHSSDLNMKSIAIECGYKNQQTFYRVFKSLNGCTPRDYRETTSRNLFRFPPVAEENECLTGENDS